MSSKYIPPTKYNPLPADYEAFIASLDPTEKLLMELAKEKLGSSFFPQWTHSYTSWKKSNKQ